MAGVVASASAVLFILDMGVEFDLFLEGLHAILLDSISGLEIWRIENFRPVPVAKSAHGKFFTGDSYVILKVSDWILIQIQNSCIILFT